MVEIAPEQWPSNWVLAWRAGTVKRFTMTRIVTFQVLADWRTSN